MLKRIIDSAVEDLYSRMLNSELLDTPGLSYRNPTFHTIHCFEKTQHFWTCYLATLLVTDTRCGLYIGLCQFIICESLRTY